MTGLRERPRLTALVPIRHHSERVPGKNYRMLSGRPLYHFILQSLQACPEIEQIVVDTDSPIVRAGLREAFPGVRVIERPEHLRGGNVSTNAVIAHDLTETQAPAYLQTHVTNPFLRSPTISRAIAAFWDCLQDHDSLFSVTRLQKRLWDPLGNPLNHDPTVLLRTQDLPPLYEENSCLYIFGRETFLRRGNRLGERPALFEIDALEAMDIDEEQDFLLAEFLAAGWGPGEPPG